MYALIGINNYDRKIAVGKILWKRRYWCPEQKTNKSEISIHLSEINIRYKCVNYFLIKRI